MNKFKVTCLACGREQIIETDRDIEIDIIPTNYDGEITITCECGSTEVI